MKKKIISLMLVCVLAICMKNTSFAEEAFSDLVNLSPVCPVQDGISVYGTDRPDPNDCVNLNNEALEFSGKANSVVLYTNKCFTGKSTISFEITNNSNSRLTVKFYDTDNDWGWSFDSIVIEANSTSTGTRGGFKADHIYYMSFSYPCDGEGKVY